MAKKPTPVSDAASVTRPERIVAYMFAAILGVAIIALFALFIAAGNAKGTLWAVVTLLPLLGFPIAILLLVVLLILNIVRRGRAAKVAGK